MVPPRGDSWEVQFGLSFTCGMQLTLRTLMDSHTLCSSVFWFG